MEEHVKEALDIVKAQAKVRNMSEEEITSMVKSLSDQFKGMATSQEEGTSEKKEQEPAVDPKKAIREKSVICLECGKKFKILTKKHLQKHGLTPDEYRQKWGYKKRQPLVSKSLARQRKNKMNEMELWKKRELYKKK